MTGTFKIKVDGACPRPPASSTVGFSLRESAGGVVGRAISVPRSRVSGIVEALAISHGVRLAVEMAISLRIERSRNSHHHSSIHPPNFAFSERSKKARVWVGRNGNEESLQRDQGIKVKEVPNYVKPMLSMDYVKKAFQKGLDNYNSKYIQTDSIQPLYHVCFGGMIFSYIVALPNERRHLEHKEHGNH
ncbi:Retrovirus-related like polyprotein [Hibiscus syriacus]|uniref:Retrovirus-related like polyprotein n=1 Tax=Hibiscus syriacus TaxID=106335 RepID=A0A6A2YFB7_HIBSY|nr:Retrovirus-related like polyprotein [Hibiscus syriacus]